MAKEKKKEEPKVSANALAATTRICELCGNMGLKPTNKYAVFKSLTKRGTGKSTQAYTSWGVDQSGQRGLIVLSQAGDDVKFYVDPTQKFTIKNVREPSNAERRKTA